MEPRLEERNYVKKQTRLTSQPSSKEDQCVGMREKRLGRGKIAEKPRKGTILSEPQGRKTYSEVIKNIREKVGQPGKP